MSSRTKHISIKYHWLKSKIVPNKIEMHRVNTKAQKADIFSKVLIRVIFELQIMLVMGCYNSSSFIGELNWASPLLEELVLELDVLNEILWRFQLDSPNFRVSVKQLCDLSWLTSFERKCQIKITCVSSTACTYKESKKVLHVVDIMHLVVYGR